MQVAVVNYTPPEVQWRALIENLDMLAGLGPGADNAETNPAPQNADLATMCTAPAVLTTGRNALSEVTKCDADSGVDDRSDGEEGDGEDGVHDDDEERNNSPVNEPDARARERRERESVRVTACCMYALRLHGVYSSVGTPPAAVRYLF